MEALANLYDQNYTRHFYGSSVLLLNYILYGTANYLHIALLLNSLTFILHKTISTQKYI